jgi:hypothetical protein
MDDEIFCEIMKRINKKKLTENDLLYIALTRLKCNFTKLIAS